MGVLTTVAARIEKLFDAGDRDRKLQDLAVGDKPGAGVSPAFDLLTSYGMDELSEYLKLDSRWLERLAEYEEMDEYGELSSALDIVADDATQPDVSTNHVVWATAKKPKVEKTLNEMFARLGMDEEAWSITRTMAKNGSDFEEMLITDEGLVGLNYLPPATMRRIEGQYGELHGFVQDFNGKLGYSVEDWRQLLNKRIEATKAGTPTQAPAIPFEDWEIAHFRLQGRARRSIYGHSFLESARWIWRRLLLMEDAALVFRLHRAPERFAFYINVGNRSDDEAKGYLQQYRQAFRKRKFLNPSTGRPDARANPPGYEEDFWLAFRPGEEGNRVEVLSTPAWQCLVGDTKIPLLDGTAPTIRELSERGGDFWTYSVNEHGHMVPGHGHSARVTHEAAEIVEVELDNGEVVRCTGNHPFLTRGGQWCKAEDLRPGVSLMPLYRRTSAQAQGDYLTGYEKVYDPASDKYRYTHHVVFEATQGATGKVWERGQIIHHQNHCKTNNAPHNLVPVGRKQHALEHVENAARLHTPAVKARATAARARPEVRERTLQSWRESPLGRVAHTERLRARMASPEQRAVHGAILSEYNRGEAHRAAVRGEKNARFVSLTVEQMGEEFRLVGASTLRDYLRKTHRAQSVVERVLRNAALPWAQFAQQYIPGWTPRGRGAAKSKPRYMGQNHRVVSVRRTGEVERVYDLTVDEHHNFAIGQGVIVHNSVEDLEYFRDKMFGAIKIPKAYMGDQDGVVRAVLSSQDIRFARTILRVQQATRKGFRRMAEVHLAALGIDPFKESFEIHQTVPSALLEMSQVEAKAARAQLALTMRDHFSLHWIFQNIYNLSDPEIEVIFGERYDDVIRDAEAQAEAQKLMMGAGGEAPEDGFGAAPEAPEGGADLYPDGPPGTANLAPAEARARDLRRFSDPRGPLHEQARERAARFGLLFPSGARRPRRGLSEEEILRGSNPGRYGLDRVAAAVKNDPVLHAKLAELGGLIQDLRGTIKPR